MAVPTAITDLSATIASNAPAGSDQAFPYVDDYLRAAYGFIRQGDTKAANVASASTVDLGAVVGRFVDVTGTTTITSFGTVAAGIWRVVTFTGALTLTHNATSLILPGGANITTAAGDALLAMSLGAGNWVVLFYQRAAGYLPLSGGTLSGALALPSDPVAALHAATKQYVDAAKAAAQSAAASYTDAGLATKSNTGHTHAWSAITDRNVSEGTNSQDPNSAAYPVILTNHANSPDSSYYWHITTTYYSTSGNVAQIAVQYSDSNRVYARSRYGGTWTSWVRCDLGEGLTRLIEGLGYLKVPGGGGLILQWGQFTHGGAGNVAATFPLAFPTSCFAVSVNTQYNGGANNPSAHSKSASGFTCYWTGGSTITLDYIAIGY